MTTAQMRLEDWMWFPDAKRLYGYVFGHPQIEDGTTVWTENVEVDFENKRASSKTNTYELGSEYNIELETLTWPS